MQCFPRARNCGLIDNCTNRKYGNTPLRTTILETIVRKSNLKQKVYDHTFAVFNLLKEMLLEMASEMDDALEGQLDRRVRSSTATVASSRRSCRCRMTCSSFRCTRRLSVSGRPPVVAESLCAGRLRKLLLRHHQHLLTFLSDSFKFNRNADEGYLIGRIIHQPRAALFCRGQGAD